MTRTRSVSPGRTGLGQRISSTPAAPRLVSGLMKCSTSWRIIMLVVCQPLAISPPNGPSLAATGSTWNGCGSYSSAKAMISASLIVKLPQSIVSPGT